MKKQEQPKKTITNLQQFMHGKLPHNPDKRHTVEDWNAAREEAKQTFSKELISQLDASGIINHFKLTHS